MAELDINEYGGTTTILTQIVKRVTQKKTLFYDKCGENTKFLTKRSL